MADDTNHGSGRDLMERHVETGDGGTERKREGEKGQRAPEERERANTRGRALTAKVRPLFLFRAESKFSPQDQRGEEAVSRTVAVSSPRSGECANLLASVAVTVARAHAI